MYIYSCCNQRLWISWLTLLSRYQLILTFFYSHVEKQRKKRTGMLGMLQLRLASLVSRPHSWTAKCYIQTQLLISDSKHINNILGFHSSNLSLCHTNIKNGSKGTNSTKSRERSNSESSVIRGGVPLSFHYIYAYFTFTKMKQTALWFSWQVPT